MKYKVVGYRGNNFYYVVNNDVTQTVYCHYLLDIGQEYDGVLDYTTLVSRYPTLKLKLS